ncbi:hypothetical protein EIK77_009591 [Talaromyces pinophilus]|jgi:hypothetical protein|nr:hypothetical protein EIK77_009591 [Talaromyces pinophilus]
MAAFVVNADLNATGGCTAEGTTDVVNGVWCIAGSESSNEQKESENHGADDNETTLARVGAAVFGPRALSLAAVLFDLLTAELVVDETTEGDRVTEELKASDGSVPDSHGSSDKKNILQDTAEGHDQRRSLANL